MKYDDHLINGQPNRSILLLIVCMVVISAARGQSPATAAVPPLGGGREGEGPTVVTVTAQAMPLSATSASVTVLTRDYIEGSHADNAADLLRAAPFLQMSQSGASGGLTSVTIRGGKPNFTMVMIDGIPVNDSTNILGGSFDFSNLPVDNIQQVEIIRGPLSSVYGSDAIGGVINFVSRRGAKKSVLDVSGELGSFLRRQARVSAAGTWKALQYSFGGSFLDVGEQVESDPYSAGSAAFGGSLSLGQNRVLEFTVRYLDSHSAGFPPGSGGSEFAIIREPLSDRSAELVLGTSFKGQVRPWWTYGVDLYRVRRTEDNTTPAVLDMNPPTFRSLPSSTSASDFTRMHFGATNHFAIGHNLSLALGIGVRAENGDTRGFLSGTIPSAFRIGRISLLSNAELRYSTTRLTATASFGFQKTEGYGEVTSPRLGLSWLLNGHGTRVKTSWAKGFKLPSFYALGNPSVGNPSLRAERSRSFDAGIEQTFWRPGVTFSATWFRNDFTDLIDFSTVTFHLLNRSKAIAQGIEFGANYRVSQRLTLGLDFTYTDWTLQNTTAALRNVPHADGGVHLDWTISSRLRTRVETQYVGKRYDFQIPVPAQTSAEQYSNTNLSADYALNERTSVYLRVDNLLNSRYHEYIGFPNQGATIRAGVQFHVFAK